MYKSYYMCPHCGSESTNMRLTKEFYFPCVEELAARPTLESIKNEVLECKCGKEMNWFQLTEVSERKK